MYKEYEGKIKMLKEQWVQLKMKFLLGYLKLLFSGGNETLVEGVNWGGSVVKTLFPLPKNVNNFKPPIWLRPPGAGENLRSDKAQ